MKHTPSDELSSDHEGIGDLAASLLRVAGDPAQVVRLHELLGGFCHQCRNSLNSLKMGLYLAKRSEGGAPQAIWAQLEAHYQAAERIIDRMQQICRPMPLSLVRLPLTLFLEERRELWTRVLEEQGRSLEVRVAGDPNQQTDVVGHYDPSRLGTGLDAFVAWRAWAGGPGDPLRLTWGVPDGQFQLQWQEPSRGSHRPSASQSTAADPLALPMLARVISEHCGSVNVRNDEDGIHLDLRWPLDFEAMRRDATC